MARRRQDGGNQTVHQRDELGALDFLVVDLPPGTGDEPLSIAQDLRPDGALIVTTPQAVAHVSSRKSVDFLRKVEIPVIGIIENMSGYECPTCGTHVDIFQSGGGERSAKELGVPFICRIPLDIAICESGDSGKPIGENGAQASCSAESLLKTRSHVTSCASMGLQKTLGRKA